MKKILLLMALLVATAPMSAKRTRAEQIGWRLAIQSYTFHKFSLMEALDKTQTLGVKYIEVYPGHKLGGQWGDMAFGLGLDEATLRQLRREAAKRGIRIVGAGVFTSQKAEEWEQMFRMARQMKLEYISCEPPLSLWNLVERLAKRYRIKVAVHNHPKPSDYWTPQNLLNAISGRSRRLGSCADVGHWSREGLDHLDCLRQLDGRIVSLHFKDIEPPRADGKWRHDVIWGKGALQMPEMLRLLQRQHFRGYLAIEYEYNWLQSVPDIEQCIRYFNRLCEADF